MSSISENQQAFASSYDEFTGHDSFGNREYVRRNNIGMSKRFYAACAAMQGMLAHSTRYHCRPEDSGLSWKEGMVKEAYELADELLKQELK